MQFSNWYCQKNSTGYHDWNVHYNERLDKVFIHYSNLPPGLQMVTMKIWTFEEITKAVNGYKHDFTIYLLY